MKRLSVIFAVLAFASVALAQSTFLRYVPICETLMVDDIVECIPIAEVRNDQRLIAWNRASRQLIKLPTVILDPSKPYTADNIGFACNGVLTDAGIVPAE